VVWQWEQGDGAACRLSSASKNHARRHGHGHDAGEYRPAGSGIDRRT